MDKSASVLIVDDTLTNIGILSACLEEHYQISSVHNGEQCLEFLKKPSLPDLILLDVEMPGMNGYQVCQKLKADPRTKSIPVIFVTTKITSEDEEKGFDVGAVDYITKPIHPRIVFSRVKAQITIKKQNEKLVKMALFDQLTDLYNRHFLLDTSKKMISSAIRHDYSISVLMIDLDHFKSINDNYGHAAGDAVLKAVAKLLKKRYRNEDIAARFGGEEFVVVMSHCTPNAAKQGAETLRTSIEKLNPTGIDISASIGVSHLNSEQDSFTDILNRADKALYEAKDAGRNQVAYG